MKFTSEDKKFMALALKEAKKTFKEGNLPVGAVLVIDGKLIGVNSNKLNKNQDWVSHAEKMLVQDYSAEIKAARREGDKEVTIYTTLEPCLMCLGTMVLHRVNRIVYSCPDPVGGAALLEPKNIRPWYEKKWPIIEGPLDPEPSYKILIEYMKTREAWKKVYDEFIEKIPLMI